MSRSEPRPEVLAFLHDIKEHPDDDAPRLILADWLEEHGDEHDYARATLIRAQVEAARLPPYHPRRVELEGIANRLCQEHQAAWLGPLTGAARRAWFERGLLRVEAHMGRFATPRTAGLIGSEAYAWLEHVHFQTIPPSLLSRLTSLPFLRSLLGLEVWPNRVPLRVQFPMANLFASENVVGLRSVRLQSLYSLDDELSQLAVSPHLVRLKALHIAHGVLRDKGVTALARSPLLGRLTDLEISGCGLSAWHLGELVASPGFQQISTLNLWHNMVADVGLAQLAGSPFCRSLTCLNLAGNYYVTGAGLAPLVSSPHLKGLRMLDLSHIPVGQAGADLLAGSSHLSQLSELRLAGSRLPKDSSPRDFHTMTDAAVAIVARSPHLTQLTTLDLSRNDLGPQAAKALASSSTLTRLTSLTLTDNHIGQEGAEALARSPILANVFFLDLSGNLIRRAGARALAASPYLQSGITLRLANNGLTAYDQVMLRERFGDRVELGKPFPEQRE